MTPTAFTEQNCSFGPPRELDGAQCGTIPAYKGRFTGGSLDGELVVVVAWKPNAEDLERLNKGGAVYLSCVSGLLPHLLATDFHTATHPA